MIALLALAGPTASGKTSVAIEIAERLRTEILSVDAMQFYRGMRIGTAAPSPEECARVKHHFTGMLEPEEQMSAGAYQRAARRCVGRLNARGRIAVAAGGSGLYLHALIDGLFEGPPRDPALREALHAEAQRSGNAALFARLQAADPEYAEQLSSPNDLVRIVRALEVHALTGVPFTELHRRQRAQIPALPALQFALDWPRDLLYARIDRRVSQMAEAGWFEETAALLDAGKAPAVRRLKALGYAEVMEHLAGRQSREAAIRATQQHHRRYAKRQLSWFRNDPRIVWIPAPDRSPGELAGAILEHLNRQWPGAAP